jgi:uncharacterized protein (DUF1015 family)
MELKPFKAFRFDPDTVGDAGDCIAPPYDVIDSTRQADLYKKNKHNIVRIIKAKQFPEDDGNNNQYTRAADYLSDWLKTGALKQDKTESMYGYVQNFSIAGVDYQRNSLITLVKLEEFDKKIIRPHEQTLNKPKIDRLNLKRATGAKFGLVFMLYDDKQKIADKIIDKAVTQQPLIDFLDEQNVRHRLFAITDTDEIGSIVEMMSDKTCVIADGHHRYETGLLYAKENPNPKAAYQMIALANTQHEGLIVLATHRLVYNLDDFDTKKLIADLQQDFEITQYDFDSSETKKQALTKMLSHMKTELANNKNAFGIYAGDQAFHVAVLKDLKVMNSLAPEKSTPWKSLDVSVLHKLILQEHLSIDETRLASGDYVQYVKDTETAIDDSIAQVDDGQKQAAFFMNPVKLQQIEDVTALGEKMPQKSTYFYPKIYTGLTINKL